MTPMELNLDYKLYRKIEGMSRAFCGADPECGIENLPEWRGRIFAYLYFELDVGLDMRDGEFVWISREEQTKQES